MSSDTFIKQTQKKVCLGNPIIDIFYEANDRFGLYTTYTVCQNTPNFKQLNLHHIVLNSQLENKIMKYIELSSIKNHNSLTYN